MKKITINVEDYELQNPTIEMILNMLDAKIEDVPEEKKVIQPIDVVKPGWQPSAHLTINFLEAAKVHLHQMYPSKFTSLDEDFSLDNFILNSVCILYTNYRFNHLLCSEDKDIGEVLGLCNYYDNNENLDVLLEGLAPCATSFLAGVMHANKK